jgi:hypothetical protein
VPHRRIEDIEKGKRSTAGRAYAPASNAVVRDAESA